MLGHDVEGVEDRAAALAGFVVARVVVGRAASRMPTGCASASSMPASGEVQVVCGAPNARAGMKGVFGPAGVAHPAAPARC